MSSQKSLERGKWATLDVLKGAGEPSNMDLVGVRGPVLSVFQYCQGGARSHKLEANSARVAQYLKGGDC